MVCGSVSPLSTAAITPTGPDTSDHAGFDQRPAPPAQDGDGITSVGPADDRDRRSWLTSQHLITGGVLVVAVAIVAYVGIATRAHRTSTVAAGQQAGEITAFDDTTTTVAVSPLDAVLVKPPSDFEEFAIAGLPNGPVSVADVGDKDEEKRLGQAGFTAGFNRVWRRIGGGDMIAKTVWEFTDEQHATAFFTEDSRGAPLVPGNRIPGAVIGTMHCGCSLVFQAIEYRKVNRVFLIFVGADRSHFTPAEANALSLEQYDAA